MATRKPTPYHFPATRWSRDDLVTALQQRRLWPRSRSSLWRMLAEADLKPHRRVYGLNSPDPDCEAQAPALGSFYLNALQGFAQGRVVMCTAEKTGRPMRQRQDPPQPIAPGKPETRAHAYIRHGVRAWLAAFVGPTGHVVWHVGTTRPRADFAAHLAHGVKPLPDRRRYDWVVDHLHTHWSLERCRLGAAWCPVPFVAKALRRGVQRRACLREPSHQPVGHFPPHHGSWLNQVALWCSVLARRFLQRGDCGAAQDFATRLCDYLEVYNTHAAHPSRWTYTGQPFVRATPFRPTRRQPRPGRACVSPRPKRFERAFYPPRPYKRAAA